MPTPYESRAQSRFNFLKFLNALPIVSVVRVQMVNDEEIRTAGRAFWNPDSSQVLLQDLPSALGTLSGAVMRVEDIVQVDATQ